MGSGTLPGSLIAFKLIALAVLYAFIPLSAFTYYLSRRRRRVVEVDRILALLKIDPDYRKAYAPDSAASYLAGVLYLSTVAGIGLTVLFFSHEIGLVNGDFPPVTLGDVEFPQQGLRWLTDRLPMVSRKEDSLVRAAPLEMIEGIEAHDVLRLEELGIDTCYDLAAADFVPLVLRTRYSPRQLIDWILQAKLCVHFGETVKDLRRLGIRTIVDLELLAEDEIQALPSETSVTAPVLHRAREAVLKSAELHRLRELGVMLGMFWNRPVDLTPPSSSP